MKAIPYLLAACVPVAAVAALPASMNAFDTQFVALSYTPDVDDLGQPIDNQIEQRVQTLAVQQDDYGFPIEYAVQQDDYGFPIEYAVQQDDYGFPIEYAVQQDDYGFPIEYAVQQDDYGFPIEYASVQQDDYGFPVETA